MGLAERNEPKYVVRLMHLPGLRDPDNENYFGTLQ